MNSVSVIIKGTAKNMENPATELLPEEVRRHIPTLYSQTGVDDPIVYAKLQSAINAFTWFVTEFSHEDNDTCFGYMFEHGEGEFGYFSLNALQAPGAGKDDGEYTPFVTRDISFMPKPLSVAIAEHLTAMDDRM